MKSQNPTQSPEAEMPQPVETESPITSLLSEFNTKLRDVEERQKLVKERVLLIGENLINSREETTKEISELKIKTESLEKEIERLKDSVSSLIEESQNFARKSEMEILQRQFKMFEPLKKSK